MSARLCFGGAAVGLIGLIGWISGTPWLTTAVPGLPPMMPNTALALLLIGAAGAARQNDTHRFARLTLSMLAALAVLVISLGTLAEFALAIDLRILRISHVLARSQPTLSPAGSSPLTALALTFLATAFLFLNIRSTARVRPSELLVLGATLTAFTGLTGIIFQAEPLYRSTSTPLIGLSLPTAVSLLLTSIGLLVGPARGGVMRVAASPGPGGSLIRRLALPVIVVPIVLGLGVTRVAQTQGIVEITVPIAILAATMTMVSVCLLLVGALPLNRAHEEIETSHTRMSQLVEHAPDGIFVADIEGRYTDVNAAGCRLLGYAREEILQKTIVDLIPASDVGRLWQAREGLLQGVVQVEEWTLRRRDGSSVPVEISAKILSDGRWQGFVRDISERKRVEHEQRLFAELGSVLATTLEYEETASRVAEVVVQGFSDFCIVDVVDDSGGLRRLAVAGRHRSQDWICDVLRRAPLDRTCPSLIESVLESRRPFVRRRPTCAEIEALTHDANHLRALPAIDLESLIVIPLIARGQLLGSMCFLSATSSSGEPPADPRIAQEIARQAALAVDNARLYREAQRATQVRDEVLGIVAHDLRNPLAMILMEARLVGERGRESEGQSEQAAQRINRAAMRMNRLIQDLLDVTRMEAGRLTLERGHVSAAEVVADAVDVLRALASSTSIELRIEMSPELPEVLADRDRLLQVFENLIGNAAKFTPPGGAIAVGAARLEREVRFWVRDTGPGIALEDQPRLFDRFWQARANTHGGAGLGLPIIKGIIEAHGGRVWVESAPGSGSTFLFTIPIALLHESASDQVAIAR